VNDTWLIRAPLALVPGVVVPRGAVQGDSYKLLRLKTVLTMHRGRRTRAGASYAANVWAFAHFAGDFPVLPRYLSPWIESR